MTDLLTAGLGIAIAKLLLRARGQNDAADAIGDAEPLYSAIIPAMTGKPENPVAVAISREVEKRIAGVINKDLQGQMLIVAKNVETLFESLSDDDLRIAAQKPLDFPEYLLQGPGKPLLRDTEEALTPLAREMMTSGASEFAKHAANASRFQTTALTHLLNQGEEVASTVQEIAAATQGLLHAHQGSQPAHDNHNSPIGAVHASQGADELEALRAADPEDLPVLVRALGAAVAAIPATNDRELISLARELGRFEWTRNDWIGVQERMLLRLQYTAMVLPRLDPVLNSFEAMVGAGGYPKGISFLDGRCMERALEDGDLIGGYVAEIRIALRRRIRDRVIARSLLPWLVGHGKGEGMWGVPEPFQMESIWALPHRNFSASRTRQFEIFSRDRQFHFRAQAARSTIDLYGAFESPAYAAPMPLETELVDPPAWWLVLVPVAASAVVHYSCIAHERGGDAMRVLDRTETLVSAKNFLVGLP